MKIRRITKREVDEHPYQVWNAFVDLLAMEKYNELAPQQRPAHLVFWYESEVQNGGHLQYFENRGTKYLNETIEALGVLGGSCHQKILQEAADLFLSRERPRIQTTEAYSAVALEGEFEGLNLRFGACSPSLFECLKAHLALHQSSFVVVI
jgi:Domain of unknown function (DUF4375)